MFDRLGGYSFLVYQDKVGLKHFKLIFLAATVLLCRLIVTKDQTVLSMVAAGNFKEVFGYLKCLVLKL